MKQTAIEWFYKKLITGKFTGNDTIEFLYETAKEMEKEQMIHFAEFISTYPDKNKNIHGEMLHAKSKYDGSERTIDLLETFKK